MTCSDTTLSAIQSLNDDSNLSCSESTSDLDSTCLLSRASSFTHVVLGEKIGYAMTCQYSMRQVFAPTSWVDKHSFSSVLNHLRLIRFLIVQGFQKSEEPVQSPHPHRSQSKNQIKVSFANLLETANQLFHINPVRWPKCESKSRSTNQLKSEIELYQATQKLSDFIHHFYASDGNLLNPALLLPSEPKFRMMKANARDMSITDYHYAKQFK